MLRSEAVIDVSAIARNVEVLAAAAPGAAVMAVVKADGYGHGIVPSARAALAGGATWLAKRSSRRRNLPSKRRPTLRPNPPTSRRPTPPLRLSRISSPTTISTRPWTTRSEPASDQPCSGEAVPQAVPRRVTTGADVPGLPDTDALTWSTSTTQKWNHPCTLLPRVRLDDLLLSKANATRGLAGRPHRLAWMCVL